MAHELDATKGRAAIAYSGETPWHRLGQKLAPGATLEEWIGAAGLDYEVKKALVQYAIADGSLRTMPGRDVLYRTDTGAALGVASERYKIVQPREVMEFFRDLVAGMGMKLEVAGALRGGAIYWATARIGLDAAIGKLRDRHEAFLLLSTSADGSRATDARITDTRVVCANTLAVAMSTGAESAVRTKHSSTFCATATKEALGLVDWESSWNVYREKLADLARVDVTPQEAESFFAELLRPAGDRAKPRKDLGAQSFEDLLNAPVGASVNLAAKAKEPAERAIRGLADLMDCYQTAPGARPGTAYGLVQGVTRYVDHGRGSDADKRLTSAWFGQGADLKTRAFEKAVALTA